MMLLRIGALGLALTFLFSSPADAQLSKAARDAYARVLSTHVANGRVDYAALAKDRADLDAYVRALGKASVPSERDAQIAFYSDAYNALVLHSVLETGQPRSVLDVKGFFNQRPHTVAGRTLTLDQLEKETLHPLAQDPRTHFVVVCAAVGCPILESTPFVGSNIETRLERATRRYLASAYGARVEGGVLFLSKIFDWYAGDFGGKDGVRTFVLGRLPTVTKEKITKPDALSFIDYNWTLNRR
jgi:hypothetical protein